MVKDEKAGDGIEGTGIPSTGPERAKETASHRRWRAQGVKRKKKGRAVSAKQKEKERLAGTVVFEGTLPENAPAKAKVEARKASQTTNTRRRKHRHATTAERLDTSNGTAGTVVAAAKTTEAKAR